MNAVYEEYTTPSGQVLQIVKGDITVETTDAIVNAANAHLQHGGGVAWAISRRGGPAIQQESDAWVRTHGPVSLTHPAWTSSGLLPAKYVIHAIGPIWGEGEEDLKLSAAISGCLRVADGLGLKSIAIPAISTGIFSFPKERAAKIILNSITAYFSEVSSGLETVRLVLFDDPTLEAFLKTWQIEKP